MANPTDNPDALGRLLKRLPTDIAPARDLWPAVAAAIATPVHASRARVWTMRIAAGLACIALGTGIGYRGYGLLQQNVAPPTADPAVIAQDVNSWLVKPVMLDAGYQKARTQLATEFIRRIATLPQADRAKVHKGLTEIENGLRDLNDALKSHPDSVLLQQLALGAYQQELEYMQNVTSLTQRVSESSQT